MRVSEPRSYLRAGSDPYFMSIRTAVGAVKMFEWDPDHPDERGRYFRWFIGGQTNLAWNCVDRHILDGNGGRAGPSAGAMGVRLIGIVRGGGPHRSNLRADQFHCALRPHHDQVPPRCPASSWPTGRT